MYNGVRAVVGPRLANFVALSSLLDVMPPCLSHEMVWKVTLWNRDILVGKFFSPREGMNLARVCDLNVDNFSLPSLGFFA